jgi:Uma2 family endonuclease
MALPMTTSPRVPVLQSGDRLTRDEFERRYDAMPHVKKAELIEGVVYMGSPVNLARHGAPHMLLAFWLMAYVKRTKGLVYGDNSSIRLDLDNAPQPDLLLSVPAAVGGTARLLADGNLEGAPELVIEVAASSVSYDLHQKLHAYRRNGVQEYLVHRVDDATLDWFRLQKGAYVRQDPDADGVVKSRVFPGLWLHVPALLQEDIDGLQEVVDRGCRTPEQAAFAARIRPRA